MKATTEATIFEAGLTLRAAALPLLCALAACAAEKPPPVVQHVPAAARPSLLTVAHSKLRPSKAQGEPAAGELKELRPCPFDPSVGELPAGGGIVLRVEAPVPSDLLVQLDTADGQQRLAEPEDALAEERFARRGLAYFYENGALTRGAATSAVVPRELFIWPGLAAQTDRRLDLLVRTASFDPRATGAERESAPLMVPLVGKCPDLTVQLSDKTLSLQQGSHRRVFVKVVPQGDGVRAMKTTLAIDGAPKGVQVTVKIPVVTSTDWGDPRENAFDLDVAADAQPGTSRLTARVQLGMLEVKALLQLTVQARPAEQ